MTVATKQKQKKLPTTFKIVAPVPPVASVHPGWIWVGSSLLLAACLWGLWQVRQPALLLLSLIDDQAAVSAYLQSFGWRGPAVLAVVQLIQVVIAFIPGHVFLVAGGYAYGFSLGFAINWISVVVASQFSFMLARWAGRPLVNRLVSADTLNRWDKIGAEKGFAFFTLSFLLPVFPTDAMNFVAGLSGIPSRKFLLANLLGRIPGVVMLTVIGSHGLRFSPITWGLVAILAVITFVVGRLALRRVERPSANQDGR
ncbi:MAG: TVP38/TMEM64 family protein [Anaerolineae bacterium]